MKGGMQKYKCPYTCLKEGKWTFGSTSLKMLSKLRATPNSNATNSCYGLPNPIERQIVSINSNLLIIVLIYNSNKINHPTYQNY